MTEILTSHETVIHGCTPMLTVEFILTVYPAGQPVAWRHQHIARAKPYEWLVIGEIDRTPVDDQPVDERLIIFGEDVWGAHFVGMGNNTAEMMSAMRQHIIALLFLLFPLDDWDWEEEE
jgi:hypothetical protein